MAGQLTIDTLKASSGVLATQNGMTGIAKAWCNFDGSTATINGSFNVSSVTRNSTGDYTVSYTTAMPNANYTAFGGALAGVGSIPVVYVKVGTTPTTTACTFYCANASGAALTDSPLTYIAIIGA